MPTYVSYTMPSNTCHVKLNAVNDTNDALLTSVIRCRVTLAMSNYTQLTIPITPTYVSYTMPSNTCHVKLHAVNDINDACLCSVIRCRVTLAMSNCMQLTIPMTPTCVSYTMPSNTCHVKLHAVNNTN
ncbi:hypothetical protein CEXT_327141 [Caerostris extrusa]|uniref:Uncharacterized protein n=1 Tax=Caerostris extrusa TaxID=172846 RepID=A0AAV4W9N5_CAEEX|nr:hypothetical protein CEXT_327141 [Caerostris extrusa]